ncbi:hypothetical protein AGABI1DRAFT_100101 [Agaricus bisporus var. burnettii JB137-S8]|uniref:Uncharacterized protein n=1 Tax=Agaricus bisporus var. burnettii (strain JB137-S8 / ATCC MYA-4627 / FGSC 10392) TaxID=597362 RepID=K5W130_AGABU|nr:uncharacterized protein AGABI1DRAFT_100101 [Agaricus bisporus var. burnettii JB137-S8]EKM80509.1 hypothetical protein AGABI1DRAFT_100101 [Agaricus bisporus var. burnettii JB137-S8]
MSNNHRASLLNGLRTGGVRSVSTNFPHSAAPGAATFNLSRFPPHPEDEGDQFLDIPQHFNNRNIPMTSAVDGNNHFNLQQAHYPINQNNFSFSPAFPQVSSPAPHNQAMSMQILQLEMMRIQAQTIQNQQYQAELIAQAQYQKQVQLQNAQNAARRQQFNYNPPATTGPTNLTFGPRATPPNNQGRRGNQADHLRAQLGLGPAPSVADDQPPMTAALGGRFGSRSVTVNGSNQSPARYASGEYDIAPPATPGSTTVISGGISLGSPASNNVHPPSKSDSVSSWRRGGSNNSVINGNRAVSSPIVKITPAPDNESESPVGNSGSRFRPHPLRFNPVVSQPLPAVTIVDTDEDVDADSSCSSDKTHSSPTTPRSSASSNEMPLSPREEASKKLFEGLGISRPITGSPEHQQYPTVSVVNHRMASQPSRQPRGPPSGADELGPRNFAARIRRKAIGGLIDARERREVIDAF